MNQPLEHKLTQINYFGRRLVSLTGFMCRSFTSTLDCLAASLILVKDSFIYHRVFKNNNDKLLNDILCTFCHHETVLKLYGNGQGDQVILLAPSAGQNPVFLERIEDDNLGKKCFFLFYCNKFRVRVKRFLKHMACI